MHQGAHLSQIIVCVFKRQCIFIDYRVRSKDTAIYERLDSTIPLRGLPCQKVSMIYKIDEIVMYGPRTVVKDFSRNTYVLYL